MSDDIARLDAQLRFHLGARLAAMGYEQTLRPWQIRVLSHFQMGSAWHGRCASALRQAIDARMPEEPA